MTNQTRNLNVEGDRRFVRISGFSRISSFGFCPCRKPPTPKIRLEETLALTPARVVVRPARARASLHSHNSAEARSFWSRVSSAGGKAYWDNCEAVTQANA